MIIVDADHVGESAVNLVCAVVFSTPQVNAQVKVKDVELECGGKVDSV